MHTLRMMLLGTALAALGCDAGGLLVVTSTVDAGGPSVTDAGGPSVTDIVNGGTVAKSTKFTVVYTVGQSSPGQDVSKSPGNRDNGGLVGAMSGP
jgi:hypothetical protein